MWRANCRTSCPIQPCPCALFTFTIEYNAKHTLQHSDYNLPESPTRQSRDPTNYTSVVLRQRSNCSRSISTLDILDMMIYVSSRICLEWRSYRVLMRHALHRPHLTPAFQGLLDRASLRSPMGGHYLHRNLSLKHLRGKAGWHQVSVPMTCL